MKRKGSRFALFPPLARSRTAKPARRGHAADARVVRPTQLRAADEHPLRKSA
jgi:hypothetical protein